MLHLINVSLLSFLYLDGISVFRWINEHILKPVPPIIPFLYPSPSNNNNKNNNYSNNNNNSKDGVTNVSRARFSKCHSKL